MNVSRRCPRWSLGGQGCSLKSRKPIQAQRTFPFCPFLSFFPFPPFLSLPPAQANGLQEPEGECSSLGLTPGAEESPAELSGSVAPLGSPPASELSEGTSDATSVASSAAQAGEAQAAESGSSVSSAPESEKEGKKSKQHLYCPTCKVTVNSLSQLEAHNTGKGIARAGDGGGTGPSQLRPGLRAKPRRAPSPNSLAGKRRALTDVALIKKG